MPIDIQKLKEIAKLLNDDKVSNTQFKEVFATLIKYIKEARD